MKGYENRTTAHGMQEVIGSTPIFSTLIKKGLSFTVPFLWLGNW